MGNCSTSTIGKPTIIKTINHAEMSVIIQKSTSCPNVILFDSYYDLIDEKNIELFLSSNLSPHKYIKEAYDCDDYAFSLVGKIREWAYHRTNKNGGLSIGLIAGDLKVKEFDNYRGHAVVFFINSDEKLRLIEADTNIIVDVTKYMTIDHVIL
jgi:hypothetical protein